MFCFQIIQIAVNTKLEKDKLINLQIIMREKPQDDYDTTSEGVMIHLPHDTIHRVSCFIASLIFVDIFMIMHRAVINLAHGWKHNKQIFSEIFRHFCWLCKKLYRLIHFFVVFTVSHFIASVQKFLCEGKNSMKFV